MNLETLEQNHEEWLIDDFVEVANQLLPRYLSEIKGNTKVKEEINPRLVRHYTSQKLIDEPIRKNRYAFYNYRHLLQFLLVRRLLSDGIGAAAIGDLLTTKTNKELKSLLIGGIQIHLTTVHPAVTETANNPALAYLTNLKREKQNHSPTTNQSTKKTRSYSNKAAINHNLANIPENKTLENDKSSRLLSNSSQWTHLEVLEGLELHIRDDFAYPSSIKEQESLNQHLIHIFTQWLKRKKHE